MYLVGLYKSDYVLEFGNMAWNKGVKSSNALSLLRAVCTEWQKPLIKVNRKHCSFQLTFNFPLSRHSRSCACTGEKGKAVYCKEAFFICTYPHLPTSLSWPILSKPQHVQIHVVLPATSQAKAKPFGSSLQLNSVKVLVLLEERQHACNWTES